MAADTTALYERILQLIPADELKDSYNAVLSEEISQSNRAVDDVVAAFAKLQEVRKAVRQLQQESIGTPSVSLTEMMDATLEMQKKLNETVDLVVTEMTKVNQSIPCGKRKTTETCGNESRKKLLKTAVKSGDIVQTTQEKKEDFQESKRVEGKPATNEAGDRIGGNEVAGDSPSVSDRDITGFLETMQDMNRLSVVERSKHIPDFLSKLADFMPSIREHKQVSIMKYVIVWAELSAEYGGSLEAYDRFCTQMTAMIDKCPRRNTKAGLQRLNNVLCALLNKIKNETKGFANTDSDFHRSYELLIWRVNAMDLSERASYIPEVLNSLKHEILRGGSAGIKTLTKALRTVRTWSKELPKESSVRQLFGEMTEHIQLLMDKTSHLETKTLINREIQQFKKISGRTPSECGRTQAQRLLKKVKQLNRGSSTKAVDTCIFLLGDIILLSKSKWKPRQDPIVKQCYDCLVKTLKASSHVKCPKQRIDLLESWM